MTETEKRRIELLQYTRKVYSEKYAPPAVHPRFRATYQSLYPSDAEPSEIKSTFGIRVLISILLFCLFVAASRSDFDTETVMLEIEKGIHQEFHSFVDLQIFD